MDREGGPQNGGSQKRPRSKKSQQTQKQNHVLSDSDGDSTSPSRSTPTKGKAKAKRRTRSPSPSMIEDIIDGFSITSFRTLDDLEVTIFICQSVTIFSPLLPVATAFWTQSPPSHKMSINCPMKLTAKRAIFPCNCTTEMLQGPLILCFLYFLCDPLHFMHSNLGQHVFPGYMSKISPLS